MAMHLKRLRAELQDFVKDQTLSGIILQDISEDIELWHVKVVGAEGTPYEGEEYLLQFKFTSEYPMEAPEVVFEGASPDNEHVYSNGHICLSILYDQWSPALTVSAICLSIQSMLSSSKEKRRPPDDEHYVRVSRGSPKKTNWAFHDEC